MYSKKKCLKGSVSRKSYTYVKKSTGKKIHVKSACVKSKGLRSKGQKPIIAIGKLKEGSLKKYGYNTKESAVERHKALKKALDVYGYSTLIKKLNAVRIYNKSRPAIYNKYTKDMNYVKRIS